MLLDLINELDKYESFRHEITSYYPDSLDKLRIKAMARKALREGYSVKGIIHKLLSDSHVQKITNKLSREKCFKLLSEIVTMADERESRLLAQTPSYQTVNISAQVKKKVAKKTTNIPEVMSDD
ncbi:MAG: hypothetical protein QNJ54_21995 [Prochloraceae cyanobacterium]|nr:hypothetical protein [Prochloraceae cyanobacterium]